MRIDELVDGLIDPNAVVAEPAPEVPEEEEEEEDDETEEEDGGAGAVSASLLQLKVDALERFKIIRALHAKMQKALSSKGSQDKTYLKLQQEISEELIEKVKATAHAAPRHLAELPRSPVRIQPAGRTAAAADIIVIGASTGGPQALKALFAQLPADCPVPIAIVLHMPVGYTEMYAAKLNEIAPLTVVEARGNEEVTVGRVFLAPAGRHLTFVRSPGNAVQAHLDIRPHDTQNRPAVDVLFSSAERGAGPRVLGVVMTGMGNDGLLGAAHVKAQGVTIITEAESSCVVYGMPRAVVEASMSDRIAPLGDMADVITERG
jgi:two-component system chemotaxis response regulator CheB